MALHEGCAIHGYAVMREIGLCDDVFGTTLLDINYKCGGIGLAASLFAKMDARKTTNVGSWNTLIAAYLQNGQAFEAFDLFRQMICRNVLPNLVTLANAILCCGELNYFRRGMSIHGYMITMEAYLIYKKNSLTCVIQAKSVLSRHDQRHAISKSHFLQFQVQ